MGPRERLHAWRKSLGLTYAALGERLDCDGSFLGHIENGRRLPGRKLANRIEAESREWDGGPILSTEWDDLERRDAA